MGGINEQLKTKREEVLRIAARHRAFNVRVLAQGREVKPGRAATWTLWLIWSLIEASLISAAC
jgi:hypothetical protein